VEALLEVSGLRLAFGGIRALQGVDLRVEAGEVVALIGPNGSGKTTLFNCVSGLYRPDAGAVALSGRSLLGLAPDAVARRGVGRTFQNLRLFPRLSVLDNLLVGRHPRYARSVPHALWRRDDAARHLRHCEQIAERLGLAAWRSRPAGDCPYGVQKRVELGRALAGEPRLLLLDEPAAGLTAVEREALAVELQSLPDLPRGAAIVVVEHDLRWASRTATRMLALEEGRVIAAGVPAEVQASTAVARAYLGD
jgi:branched-chain amino acid transport system ATP-binding protein